MSFDAPSGRAPQDRRPWPFRVKAVLWSAVAVLCEVAGLVLLAHAAGLGDDPADETTAHVVWGGLLTTAGVLALVVVAGLAVRRTPPP